MILKREVSINVRSDQCSQLAMDVALDARKYVSKYLVHLNIMRTQVSALLKLVGRQISETKRQIATLSKKEKQMATSKTYKPALRQNSRPNGAGPSKVWRA